MEASIHTLLEVFLRNKWGGGISPGTCWIPHPDNMNFCCAVANNVLIPGRIQVKGNGHVEMQTVFWVTYYKLKGTKGPKDCKCREILLLQQQD